MTANTFNAKIAYLWLYYFCRNDVNVEGSTHKQVVDLIRSGGDVLTLTGNFMFAQVMNMDQVKYRAIFKNALEYTPSQKRKLDYSTAVFVIYRNRISVTWGYIHRGVLVHVYLYHAEPEPSRSFANFHLILILVFFAVISIPHQATEKLDPSDDSSGPSLVDYSEKRSLPLTIPDYQHLEQNGEKYTVRTI